jgi:hypothetical protein
LAAFDFHYFEESAMKRMHWILVLVATIGVVLQVASAASIEQQLIVVTNDKTLNGNFQIAVQVKGTGLTAANTLGSATIDVDFENTKLSYQNATVWAFGPAEGYARSATNNTTYIRVGVLGTIVNGNGDGSPAGFDIGASYVTWVQLNFKILDANASANLNIATGSNAIGIFENHSNDPLTGVINDQTLSGPINIINVSLPVQLVSFTAGIVQESGNVVLKWSTASETNNYGFELQKAQDGSKNYQTIANSFIAGHGTTVESHTYSYTDANATQGVWSYRLKQTDLDGTVHYSEEIRLSSLSGVAEVAPRVFQLLQNYPNPFNPSTQVKFSVETTEKAVVKVYNMLGAEVATLFDGTAEAGRYYVARFDGTKLASGIYFSRLITEKKTDVKRMLMVK